MNLNYTGTLQGMTWHWRLCCAVWMVLTALMIGENVLVHCRQGRHRSGLIVMLVMSILAPWDACDYETIEKKYFARNGWVAWSELHEWWISDDGKRWVLPDRWRIWNRWCELDLSSYVTWFRGQEWVHQILSRMQCPPVKFDAFTPWRRLPESSVQHERQCSRSRTRSRSRSRAAGPLPKPLPKKRPTSMARPQASNQPVEQSSTSSSSEVPQAVLRPTSKVVLRPTSKARPQANKQGCPQANQSSSAGSTSSQPDVLSPSPVSSVQHPPVQFWNGLGELGSSFDGEPEYEEVCKHLGVWAMAQEQEEKAQARANRAESPEPDRESALWGCALCGTYNTVHNLVCSVASCMARRPLLQHFRADLGDWFCTECNNHNRGYRMLCNWTACPSRDWVCECGNLSRSNRKCCQARTCSRPRPFELY